MGRRRKSRLYWREGRGWYADLRDFRDVGGRREAMIAEGGDRATLDADEAGSILQARLEELKMLRAGRGAGEDPRLEDYARYHLTRKAEYRRETTVGRDERALRQVLAFFGTEIRLSEINVGALTTYVSARRHQAGAREEQTLHPRRSSMTGGRAQEVLGLEHGDIDLENGQVHFRPNRYRTLKRARHKRWIPLWPQLREVVTAHIEGRHGLLFPSAKGTMLRDIRGAIASAVKRAEIQKRVTPHTFRHTYAATRLQTMDHGHPVSPYTVMRELGHSSLSLIEKTYGHLLEVRHRSPVVEYRRAKVVPFRRQARGAQVAARPRDFHDTHLSPRVSPAGGARRCRRIRNRL